MIRLIVLVTIVGAVVLLGVAVYNNPKLVDPWGAAASKASVIVGKKAEAAGQHVSESLDKY